MSMPLTKRFTADDVRALPDDGNRYETVHGELLVTPAPAVLHQLVSGRLYMALGTYLMAHGLEQLLSSPADVSWDDDTLVQPDLFVADMAMAERTGKWSDLGTVYFVIEIVSPSSATADRITKRRLYQDQGIPEYWVVDIDRKQIEVWTPVADLPVYMRDTLTWRHPTLEAECVIDIVALFTFGGNR
jgi:Uma2 family endonuclease